MEETLFLTKNNLYNSGIRNTLAICSLGTAIFVFAKTKLLNENKYKYHIYLIGIALISIGLLYGINNVYDYDNYIYENQIMSKHLKLQTINNDILLMKIILSMIIILITLFYFIDI